MVGENLSVSASLPGGIDVRVLQVTGKVLEAANRALGAVVLLVQRSQHTHSPVQPSRTMSLDRERKPREPTQMRGLKPRTLVLGSFSELIFPS